MSYTLDNYTNLERAYNFFNARFFNSTLPACLITLQRKKNAAGYFSYDRFSDAGNTFKVHEIALNPSTFDRGMAKVFSTLLHEISQ